MGEDVFLQLLELLDDEGVDFGAIGVQMGFLAEGVTNDTIVCVEEYALPDLVEYLVVQLVVS